MNSTSSAADSQLTDLTVPLQSFTLDVIQQCTCSWCGKPVPESTLFCDEKCRKENEQQDRLNGGF
ncbi:MAG: DUF2116 family Zn-ribbon domain-containing protein [Pararheinheimera sp.]|nr:DUF2116 family Zn-ribbon domain-containing protein [Rheinheimera sp.]